MDPPLAITPPVLRVTIGSDALFMATEYITDFRLDYTWFFDGRFFFNTPNEYSGQFTTNLTVLNAQKSDEGNYSVEVFIGGAGGRVTAQLFVCKSLIIIIVTIHLSHLCLQRIIGSLFLISRTLDHRLVSPIPPET